MTTTGIAVDNTAVGGAAAASSAGGSTPAGLGAPMLALGAVQAVSSMLDSYYKSKLMKIQYKWAAEIAEENKKMTELAAENAFRRSHFRIGEISREGEKLKARQRVAMAANGVARTGGTYAEVLTSTDIFKKESMLIEELNGYNEAWGFRRQGLSYGAQAGAARATARSASPILSGISGFGAGAASAFDTYTRVQFRGKY